MDEEGVNVEEDDEDEEDQIFALGGGRMCSLAVLIRADKRNACPSEVAAVASNMQCRVDGDGVLVLVVGKERSSRPGIGKVLRGRRKRA